MLGRETPYTASLKKSNRVHDVHRAALSSVDLLPKSNTTCYAGRVHRALTLTSAWCLSVCLSVCPNWAYTQSDHQVAALENVNQRTSWLFEGRNTCSIWCGLLCMDKTLQIELFFN